MLLLLISFINYFLVFNRIIAISFLCNPFFPFLFLSLFCFLCFGPLNTNQLCYYLAVFVLTVFCFFGFFFQKWALIFRRLGVLLVLLVIISKYKNRKSLYWQFLDASSVLSPLDILIHLIFKTTIWICRYYNFNAEFVGEEIESQYFVYYVIITFYM